MDDDLRDGRHVFEREQDVRLLGLNRNDVGDHYRRRRREVRVAPSPPRAEVPKDVLDRRYLGLRSSPATWMAPHLDEPMRLRRQAPNLTEAPRKDLRYAFPDVLRMGPGSDLRHRRKRR